MWEVKQKVRRGREVGNNVGSKVGSKEYRGRKLKERWSLVSNDLKKEEKIYVQN